MLSKADFIINTYGSSFALEASQLRMIPVVSLWNNLAIHHMSKNLKLCGHMQYLRSFGKAKESSFVESGTIDNRIVNASIINLYKCPYLADWLDEVYCPTD